VQKDAVVIREARQKDDFEGSHGGGLWLGPQAVSNAAKRRSE